MKVIFLDFNSVLDTNIKMNEINYDNLQRLKRIVMETGAKIVISSSIKNSYYMTGVYSQMLQMVLYRLISEGFDVVGMTKYLENRELEIATYLMEHKDIENYCIIDDDYDMESMKEHMVKLPNQIENGQMGLDEYHTEMAINILGRIPKEEKEMKLKLASKM